MVNLPVWCSCGKIITFSNEDRCEDCYALDQEKYPGKPTRVDTPHLSIKQEAESERRKAQIQASFQHSK